MIAATIIAATIILVTLVKKSPWQLLQDAGRRADLARGDVYDGE
jgi:hypothetical protein